MEKDTVDVENRLCSSSNLVSKNVESSIKIDSISIDLINAKDKSSTAENCDHFSIRKYVFDIRKKDWKMCWPFASDDKCDQHERELPPLHVPKFRYWRCENCLRDIKAGDVETDQGPTFGTCNCRLKSNIICSHAPILRDDVVVVTDLNDPPEINLDDANASTNTNETSGFHPSLSNDKRKKKKDVTDFLTLAQNLVSVDNSNKEVHQLTSGHSYHVDKAFGHREVANTDLDGNLNRVLRKAAVNIEEKVITADDMQTDLVAYDISGEHYNNTNEAHKTSKGNGPEMGESDNASSDSAEVMPGKNLCRGSSSGLHRRKTRKVRLIADLLSENGNGKPIDLQRQAVIQGNSRRVLGQHRKRKLDDDEDEDWRPLVIDSPSKVCKEGKILKRDVESAETIAKAFSRMRLQSSMKNHSTKIRSDGNPVLGKKKYKKAIVFDDLVPVKDVSLGAKVKTIDASTRIGVDEILPNPIPEADKGKDTEFFLMPSQRTDKIPTFMKKNKNLHVVDQQDSSIPWKDAGFLQGQAVRIPFHSARDATSGMGQNLSLGSYLNMPRYDMQHNPLVEDIDASLLSWHKRIAKEDLVSKKDTESIYVRNLNCASKYSSDMPFGREMCSAKEDQVSKKDAESIYARNLNCASKYSSEPFGREIGGERSTKGITSSVPFLGENQNYTSQVEIGSCSHMQQKNFGSANSSKKAIEIQERPTLIRKETEQRANKAPEQGNVDDIPMEIVELMAKNQYERCLPDAEHDRCQTINFNKVNGNREVNLFQKGTSQKRNPRNGITDSLGPMKQKVDYFGQPDVNRFTMSQLHQTPVPSGYQSLFPQSSSRIQHSSSSSSRQKSAQNCKWIGDLVGKMSSQNSLQTSGSCNSCMNMQQHRSNHQIWLPSHMPFLYTGPQKCNSLTNTDLLSNSTNGVHKENMNGDCELKFPNQNSASIGKKDRNFGLEIPGTYQEHQFSGKNNGIELNKKPMGSLDLYANETIPAMHLLSLMDAGLRSRAPINLDVSSKFDQDPNEFSRPSSGAYKISNAMTHTSYGKNQHTEDFHRSISSIPTVAGPSSLFQHDKSFNKAIDFTAQTSQEKVKGKGYRWQKSKHPGANSGSTQCGSVPVHSMPAMFFGGSDSVKIPPLQPTKNKLEAPNGTRLGRPPKSSSETLTCSVNRNPADYSAPEARNPYMIAGKDLKFRRAEIPLPPGYDSTRLNAQKRRKKLP